MKIEGSEKELERSTVGERIKEKGARGSRAVETNKSTLRESNKVPSYEEADDVRQTHESLPK